MAQSVKTEQLLGEIRTIPIGTELAQVAPTKLADQIGRILRLPRSSNVTK